MARPVNQVLGELRAEHAQRRAAETALTNAQSGFQTAQAALRAAGDHLAELERELHLALFEEAGQP